MENVDLSVGSGGKRMREFIKVVVSYLNNEILSELHDSAFLEMDGKIGFTTDSFVVDPIFFPGGDIGKLAVAGTFNDLVVSGIEPKYLSLSFIIEEGFPMDDMKRILNSIKKESIECGVKIVTGDTKVVRRGEAHRIYINTSGVGRLIRKPSLSLENGDAIILTGPIGEHSASVMVARGEYELEGEILTDCASMKFLLPLWRDGAIWMRDITRGGLATVLCELSKGAGVPILIDEELIPISESVRTLSEFLGIDPLYLACEGRALIVSKKEGSGAIISALKNSDQKQTCAIGEVGGPGRKGEAILRTRAGGFRLLEELTGELLPRIC